MTNTTRGPDGLPRCGWCAAAPAFVDYHDHEWGYPVSDDIRLFEKICLESFQSGLSWRTILAKRENFRTAFAGFDYRQVAQFDETDVDRLLTDAGIIRHRGKISAVINNARRCCDLVADYGSLAAYVWQFEETETATPQTRTTSLQSVAMSKDLKKRGWKFVGPTTVFAFMQAMGLLNDHAETCAMRAKATAARRAFSPPA